MSELTKLRMKAKEKFNAYIRERDKDKGCITCGGTVEHACHLYSANIYWWLEFDEVNVNGGCRTCNYYVHPVNEHMHHHFVKERHGFESYAELVERATGTRTLERRDRQFFKDLIEKYKNQNAII